MSIRHLVVASLLISAGAAQADVVSSTSQPAFQNGWTTGNGSSVIGSGVFGSGVSLVGGIAHNANTDLTSVGRQSKRQPVAIGCPETVCTARHRRQLRAERR